MKSLFELIIGNLDEKNAYRQINKRAKALPRNYYAAYKKICNYLFCYGEGCSMEMLSELLDLLEAGARDQKKVSKLLGADVATFCDELISAVNTNKKTRRDKLNQEIEEYFSKRGQGDVLSNEKNQRR